MTQTVSEPLRDLVGRALYEEPGNPGRPDPDWYSLNEVRREPWRKDADRAISQMAQVITERVRHYAENYPIGSDGRNTFIIFAEWVESLASQKSEAA